MISAPDPLLRLPTFASSSVVRGFAFALLYGAQGVLYALLVVALPAYLAARGVSATEVGAVMGTILLPWGFKFFSGPLMDRFTVRSMGHRRPWVLAAQSALVLGLLSLSFISDPARSLGLLAALGFIVNLAVAFQDVAVDGLAIDVIPEAEQARMNGFMWGGRTIGLALASPVCARLLDLGGLGLAALACAGVTALVWLVPLLLRERPGEKLLPWSASGGADPGGREAAPSWVALFRNLWAVLTLPTSLFVMATSFVYTTAHGIWTALLPTITTPELGWADSWYADTVGSASLASGLAALGIGAGIVQRVGRLRSFSLALGAILLLSLALGTVPVLRESSVGLGVAVFLYTFLRVAASIAFFATAMALCQKSASATQYATYMALSNLGVAFGAALLGPASAWLDPASLFLVMAGALAVAIGLLRYADLETHRRLLDEIDERELERRSGDEPQYEDR